MQGKVLFVFVDGQFVKGQHMSFEKDDPLFVRHLDETYWDFDKIDDAQPDKKKPYTRMVGIAPELWDKWKDVIDKSGFKYMELDSSVTFLYCYQDLERFLRTWVCE